MGCHGLLQLGTTLVEYNFSTDLCRRMVSGVSLGAHNLDCLHVKFTAAFVLLWESNATADLPAGEAQVEVQVIWSGYKQRWSFDCCQPLTSRWATDCYQSMIWGLGPPKICFLILRLHVKFTVEFVFPFLTTGAFSSYPLKR